MSGGFVKLYGQELFKSTLWVESVDVRFLFIGMLADADPDGVVRLPSTGVLALRMNMPLDRTEAALAVLEAPDKNSRSKEEDGRRVVRVEDGWRLVNYAKYRERQTEKQIRDAERQRKYRNPSVTQSDVTVTSQPVTQNSATDRGRVATSPPEDRRQKTEDKEEDGEMRARGDSTFQNVKLAYAKRFVMARAAPASWSPKNLQHAQTVASWVDDYVGETGGEDERDRCIAALMDAFFADSWAASKAFPIGAMANDPSRYLKPPAEAPRALPDPAEERAELLAQLNVLQGDLACCPYDKPMKRALVEEQMNAIRAKLRTLKGSA